MTPEAHEIRSASGAYSRNVWWVPADDASKLCVFLDAEYYLEKMNTAATLLELQATGAIPPVNCLFVSNLSPPARQEDYICDPEYSRYIADDIVGWAQTRVPQLGAGGHTICGLSLSGLAAAFLTLARPEIFSGALCQSASLWWNDEWLLHQVPASLTQKSRFWLSVGDKERQSGLLHVKLFQGVPQVDAVERMAALLAQRECEVHYNLFAGGHEIPPWKEELPQALDWLYRLKDA